MLGRARAGSGCAAAGLPSACPVSAALPGGGEAAGASCSAAQAQTLLRGWRRGGCAREAAGPLSPEPQRTPLSPAAAASAQGKTSPPVPPPLWVSEPTAESVPGKISVPSLLRWRGCVPGGVLRGVCDLLPQKPLGSVCAANRGAL